MEEINLSELLGARNTGYERNKVLKEWRKEHPCAEIIFFNKSHYMIVADEVMSMEELLDSELVSEAQKKVIRQTITGRGEFKTVYRNKIIETFEQYYQFVKFSNGKGASRKLLLGNKKTEPDLKIDKRGLGNNSLPYASIGADVLNQFICAISNGAYEVPPSNMYTDEHLKTVVYFTKFEWWERVFMNTTAISSQLAIPNFVGMQLPGEIWDSLVKKYKNEKKGFYKTRLNSFVTYLSKSSALKFEDRLIGAHPNSEKTRWDEAHLLDKSIQEDILCQEKTLLEKYSLTYFDAYYTKKEGVNEFKEEYNRYIRGKFNYTKTWRVLAVEINNTIENAELNDKCNICLEEIKKSLRDAVEEDWKPYLEKYIKKKKADFNSYENLPTTNIHLPWDYYNSIFEGYVYHHLDEHFGFGLFNRADKSRYLEEHFSPVNKNYTLSEEVSELIELGVMTEEDVQSRLNEEHENYVLGIYGYRALSELYEQFCSTGSIHEDDLEGRRTTHDAFSVA